MPFPAEYPGGLLAAYCRAHGLDVEVERAGVRRRQAESARMARQLAQTGADGLAEQVLALVDRMLASELPDAVEALFLLNLETHHAQASGRNNPGTRHYPPSR